jgi:hypothetical protein
LPALPNTTQADADADGLGDPCDPFPQSPDNVAGTTRTALFFDSEAGDYIGAGQRHVWTPADGIFAVRVEGGQRILTDFFGGLDSWGLVFAAPSQIVPGVYENAQRWPFESPVLPGMDVSGSGRAATR